MLVNFVVIVAFPLAVRGPLLNMMPLPRVSRGRPDTSKQGNKKIILAIDSILAVLAVIQRGDHTSRVYTCAHTMRAMFASFKNRGQGTNQTTAFKKQIPMLWKSLE